MVALCFAAGAAGWWLAGPDVPGEGSVDVGFYEDMTTHHQQAVELAFAYLEGSGTGVLLRHMAREVATGQSLEVGRMQQKLQEWNRTGDPETAMGWMGMSVPTDEMPGLVSDEDIAALRASSGRDADDLFSRLMTEHHRGGLHMADDAAERAGQASVRRLAAAMADGQRSEIAELEAARGELGLAPVR